MKPVAVTSTGTRRDFFWLGGDEMMTSSPVSGLGFNLHLGGGPFVSVPAAVSSLARRRPGLGADVSLAAGNGAGSEAGIDPGSADDAMPEIIAFAPGPLGQDNILGALTHRIDLFGLGPDYAMLAKTIWGELGQDDRSPWFNLGGIFTSAPSAVAWAGGRVDVFGVGLDHALYTKRRRGERWSADWRRLGGAFTSAASLVVRGPQQLDLFIRGADYTLRRNHGDGENWFGWQNLGGNLASPPTAVSWGPERVDIFAIFKDRALWHRWWDGEIWNDWESLGGRYSSEPAVASWAPGRFDIFVRSALDGLCNHLWYDDNSWNGPEVLNFGTSEPMGEAATALSIAPNHLDVFVPTIDREIREGIWDGSNWQFGATSARLKVPSRFRFSVDRIKVHTTRALNSDTVGAAATVMAGNAAPITRTQWVGKIGGVQNPKETQTNALDFDHVTVDLAEPVSFSYIVVNNGNTDQTKILAALASGSDSLSLASSASLAEQVAKGVVKWVSLKIVGLLAIDVPVIGSALKKIETWLLGKLTDTLFKSCDGLVAVEVRAIMGRDLYMQSGNGTKTLKGSTRHPGSTSPANCGAASDYEVFWTIKPQP